MVFVVWDVMREFSCLLSLQAKYAGNRMNLLSLWLKYLNFAPLSISQTLFTEIKQNFQGLQGIALASQSEVGTIFLFIIVKSTGVVKCRCFFCSKHSASTLLTFDLS